MKTVSERIRSNSGLIGIMVSVMLLTLAGGAAFLSAVITNSENQRTFDILTDTDATQDELNSVSDQDIRNVRNNLNDQLGLATNFISLGTAPLPGNTGPAGLLTEAANGVVAPAVVNYVTDPGSSWNRNDGADRPDTGTAPVDPDSVTDPDPVDDALIDQIFLGCDK